jgi:hypothetical protein
LRRRDEKEKKNKKKQKTMVYVRGLLKLASLATAAAKLATQQNGGLCVDVKDWALHNGGRLQVWGCSNGGANQEFALNSANQLVTGSNMCVDLPDGNAYSGAPVQVWQCAANNPNQKWKLINGNMIQKAGTNMCLDLKDGRFADGGVIQVWACAQGNKNQQFVFTGKTPAPAPAPAPNNGGLLNEQTFSGFWFPSWSNYLKLHPIIAKSADPILSAAAAYNLPPQLLASMFLQETSANCYANSDGCYQFSDVRSWAKYSNNKPLSERQNIWTSAYAAANYVRDMMNQNNGSLDAALRIYSGNWGNYIESIRSWSWTSPYGPGLKRAHNDHDGHQHEHAL